MKEEMKEKTLSGGEQTVAKSFPLLVQANPGATKKKEPPPGSGPPITIAPKMFSTSICTKALAMKLEQTLDAKISAFKNLEKNSTDGFYHPLILKSMRSGASASLVVSELIQLARSLICRNDSVADAPSLKKQQSIALALKQKENFMSQFIQIIDQALTILSKEQLSAVSLEDQAIIIGALTIVGGWQAKARSGS